MTNNQFKRIRELISRPVKPSFIRWRVGQSGIGNNGPWARMLAYLDARDYRLILDNIFGPRGFAWYPSYQALPGGGFLCTIHFFVEYQQGNAVAGKWFQFSDGADETQIEATKGGISDAFKRTCLAMGITEDFYKFGDSWAKFSSSGKLKMKIQGQWYSYDNPDVPEWYIKKYEEFNKKKEAK